MAAPAAAPTRPPDRRTGGRTPQALRRSGQHGLVLVAATLCVLLACVVLAALAALVDRSVDAGAAAQLAADPNAAAQVSAPYRTDGTAQADRAVRQGLAHAFADVPQQTFAALEGQLPLSPAAAAGPGLALHPVAVQGAAAHARLLSGRWPAGAADPAPAGFRAGTGAGDSVDAALTQWTAERLHVGTGSTVVLRDARRRSVTVHVTGVFRATGPEAFWAGVAGGADAADQVFVLAPGELLGSPTLSAQVLVQWTALPDPERVSVAALPGLARRIEALVSGGSGIDAGAGYGRLAVGSALGQAVAAVTGPAAVSRSGLLLPTALLACLALTALVLTARQLAAHRHGELVLRLVRGAGPGRLLGQAVAEWALTAVPAGVAAGFLAVPLLHALQRAGLVGVTVPGTGPGLAAWGAVVCTLAVHGAAVLLPALRAVLGRRSGSRVRVRGARAAAAQRVGADLALLLVAVLGFVRLEHYRSAVVTTGDGGTAVDPVLVLLPTAATVAAALLLLRLLPLASRWADRAGRRRRDLVLPLAGWQLGRRSARVAGPTLLVCLAVSVGALAATALSGLNGLAHDQAVFEVGADVLVDTSGGGTLPAASLREAYLALPGVTGATPVTRTLAGTASGDLTELVGLDTTAVDGHAAVLPRLRADLAGRDYPARMAALAQGLGAPGLTLPGRPTALRLDETLTSDGDTAAPVLRLTLEDAAGLTDTVDVALPPADGVRHTVDIALPRAARGTRTYPLTVTGLGILPQPARHAAQLTLAVHRLGTPQGWASRPAGLVWTDRTASAADARATACEGAPVADSYQPGGPGVCALAGRGADLLTVRLRTAPPPDHPSPGLGGTTVAGGSVRLVLVGAQAGAPLPVLADTVALSAGHARVGSTLTLTLDDGTTLPVRITGSLAAVPSDTRSRGHFVADQRQLAMVLTMAGGTAESPTSWWLAGADPAATAAAIAADPRLGTARTTAQAAAELRADPFRQGMRAVLTLCMLLAPAFAVIGFTVHAVISARERRREFALLRAIGVRARTLSALLWTELLGVALFAVVPGALLGTGLAAAIMPRVTADDAGGALFPPLRLRVPWGQVALTATATAAAILLVVMALSRLLARVDLVRVLRAGEEPREVS